MTDDAGAREHELLEGVITNLARAPTSTRSAAVDDAKALIEQQARDEGLWFYAHTAPEAYLQAALRHMHDMAERLVVAQARAEAQAYDLLMDRIRLEKEAEYRDGALARAEQQRDEALALLRELEWAGANIDTRRQVCPCCDEYPNGDDGGHAPDCALAAALAAQQEWAGGEK